MCNVVPTSLMARDLSVSCPNMATLKKGLLACQTALGSLATEMSGFAMPTPSAYRIDSDKALTRWTSL